MKRQVCALTMGLFFCLLIQGIVPPVLAAEQTNDMEAAAAHLRERGVMVGDGNGDMRLNDGLNRAELAVLLTRLHGGPGTNPEHYTWACYFTDVPQWAKPYVGYCTATLLVSGYGNQIYGAADPVIPAAACTVILRACGYEDGDGSLWNYNTACSYAANLGLISQSTAQASTISRGEMALLIYRALQKKGSSTVELEKTVPDQMTTYMPQDNPTSKDIVIHTKTITHADWSIKDFSVEADPTIFNGCYTRSWYNAIRQSIVDKEVILAGNDDGQFNPGYLYAHTTVPGQSEAAFTRLLGQLRGVTSYRLGAEPYTKNQYEYPGYGIVKVCRADAMDAPLAFIWPKLEELAGKSDREKVISLNDYLCDLLDYGYGVSAGVAEIFSPRSTPALGKCGSYSSAFSFLCEAEGIPCVTVLSADHSWNEVYVDGQWLTVDVTFNDVGTGRSAYLLSTGAPSTDLAPDSTRFAKELLIPGSTTKQ